MKLLGMCATIVLMYVLACSTIAVPSPIPMSGEENYDRDLFNSIFGGSSLGRINTARSNTNDPRVMNTSRPHTSGYQYDAATQSGANSALPFRGSAYGGAGSSSYGSQNPSAYGQNYSWGQQPSEQYGHHQGITTDAFEQSYSQAYGQSDPYAHLNHGQAYTLDSFGQMNLASSPQTPSPPASAPPAHTDYGQQSGYLYSGGTYGGSSAPSYTGYYGGYGGQPTYPYGGGMYGGYGGSASSQPPSQESNYSYGQDSNQPINEGTDQGPNQAEGEEGVSEMWDEMPPPEQNAVIEMLYDYTGLNPEYIKRMCKMKMSEDVGDSLFGGYSNGVQLASEALFNSLKKTRRRGTWAEGFGPEEVEAVLSRMVDASGRGEVFVWNALARKAPTRAQIREILDATSSEELRELAGALQLTENRDPVQRALRAARALNTEVHPWTFGTRRRQRVPLIINKIMRATGKSDNWAYEKLRLSGSRGLGVEIKNAEGNELEKLMNYLRSLKKKKK